MAATTPAKKAPARRRPTAATAARREVRNEADYKPVEVNLTFRGEKFRFVLDKLAQEKVYWRQQAANHFSSPEATAAVLFEILGPVDSNRFINTMRVGDEIFTAAIEFMDAFNKAAADPNS